MGTQTDAQTGETRRFFDGLAPGWDAAMVDADAQIRAILGVVGIAQGAKVLDVACGTGVMFPYLMACGPKELHAIDLSPEMVRRAAAKYDDPRLRVEEADFLQYTGGGYDLVVVYNAYPHFLDKRRFAQKAAEVLAPGGRLLIAHGSSRAVINGRHSGGAVQDVSDGLLPCAGEAQRLGDAFAWDVMADTSRLYILSGIAKA